MIRKLSLGLALSLCIALGSTGCTAVTSGTSGSPSSTASGSDSNSTTTSTELTTTTTAEAQAETLLEQMTLRQKAAQVLLLDFSGVETGSTQLRELLADSPPGGLMIMGRNVQSVEQVKAMVAFFQDTVAKGGSPVRLLIAVDQEGGTVQRIHVDGVPAIPAARTLGSTSTPTRAAEIATQTATELLSMGVNMNLAPVADVVTGKGEFLYSRTYSGEPERVAEYVTAVANAFNRRGLITVLKHFPGHGSASGDTHTAAVISTATREEFETVHLVPFEAGIQAGAEGVMVAHILAKAYDPKYPATSSEKVVEGLLREQLGFTGVVVTDALEMAAARTVGGKVGSSTAKDIAETAVSALNAGCDLLISTGTLSSQLLMLDTIVSAVKGGRLPLARLNEAVTRVLELKVRHGLEAK